MTRNARPEKARYHILQSPLIFLAFRQSVHDGFVHDKCHCCAWRNPNRIGYTTSEKTRNAFFLPNSPYRVNEFRVIPSDYTNIPISRQSHEFGPLLHARLQNLKWVRCRTGSTRKATPPVFSTFKFNNPLDCLRTEKAYIFDTAPIARYPNECSRRCVTDKVPPSSSRLARAW
jgi:hypothetical protein